MNGPHDERADYADDPALPYGRIDGLFLDIEPIHFILLVLVPCWWPLGPAVLGWAGLGIMVCRHPAARRNAVILLVIALGQTSIVAVYVFSVAVARGSGN